MHTQIKERYSGSQITNCGPTERCEAVRELAGLSGTFCPVSGQLNFPRVRSGDRDKRAEQK